MNKFFQLIDQTYGAQRGKFIRDVCNCVRTKVVDKNLFGWRSYIEDVLEDLVMHMISTSFKYSGGAYVTCGVQSAIDHSRYCSREKRRGDYELLSLDDLIQVQDYPEDEPRKTRVLLFEISIKFGQPLADELEPFLTGKVDQIDKAIRDKLSTPEFRDFLKEMQAC